MDRDSTGETPSALCPPHKAGFTLNQMKPDTKSLEPHLQNGGGLD